MDLKKKFTKKFPYPEEPDFILASTSPRRRQLLDHAGIVFEIRAPKIDETPHKLEKARSLVERLSISKALAVETCLWASRKKYSLILAADTTVISPNRKNILNKPSSLQEAGFMLKALSGKKHTVLTAFTIILSPPPEVENSKKNKILKRKIKTQIVETHVTMATLSQQLISNYLQTGEPLDKAGSYAAQGIGMCLIQKIQGSYTNVIGLPMVEVLKSLKDDFGFCMGLYAKSN